MKFLFLIFLSINFSFSQSATELLEKKENLLQEIQLSKKTLESAKKQKKISIEELQALTTHIDLRESLKSTIIQQKDSIELYKIEIEEKIKHNEERKEMTLNSYKKLIKSLYFIDFEINLLDFIFSTQSFKEAIDLFIYYKEQEDLRLKLFNELDYLNGQLLFFKNSLNKNIALKDTLINEFNSEKDSLNFLKKDKERITRDLSSRENELSGYIQKKQNEAKAIESEIIQIQKQLALERTQLSKDLAFEKNKNNLIWPVEKGILLSQFGEVFHKDLPGIKIINNGVEIGVEKDAKVRSVFDGVVTKILITPNGLKAVIVRHGQYLTVYSNLKVTNVQVGQKILKGNKLGTVFANEDDDSGILEFQIWKGLEKINPMNWLKNN